MLTIQIPQKQRRAKWKQTQNAKRETRTQQNHCHHIKTQREYGEPHHTRRKCQRCKSNFKNHIPTAANTVAQHISLLSATPGSHTVLLQAWLLHFLLLTGMGKQRKMVQVLGSLHPHGRCRCRSMLLAWAWHRPGLCSYLGSERASRQKLAHSVFLILSLNKINLKQTNTFWGTTISDDQFI